MAYVYSSGNAIVDSLRGIEFTGNIIPTNWYKTITNDKGKPDLTAIVILADILYWYRPSIVRTDGLTQEEYLRKKIQRSGLLTKKL